MTHEIEGTSDVSGLQGLMITADGEGLGVGQRLLKPAGELVHPHGNFALED